MKESSFVILHDGIILDVCGAIPGKIILTVDCKYLRQKHRAIGEYFTIELTNCKKLVYVNDDSSVLTDPRQFAEAKIQILSAEMINDTVEVYCSAGTLTLEFTEAIVYLNPTTIISVEDLEDLACKYWDSWEQSPTVLQH